MWRVDPLNPRAGQLHDSLKGLLDHPFEGPEHCLVLGGDGWMLRSMHEVSADTLFIGLNAGSLGFLLNDVSDLHRAARALNEQRWTAHSFPRLAMVGTTPEGERRTAAAVNDLYIERRSGQTSHLRVSIDDVLVVDKLVCDGLIVSTALGSTAYTFSAGGVPCHPLVPALQVTPIAPHGPRLSPIVLPLDARIRVQALSPERRPVRAVADGIEVGPITEIEVARADSDVRLAFLEGHQFTRALIAKVLKS